MLVDDVGAGPNETPRRAIRTAIGDRAAELFTVATPRQPVACDARAGPKWENLVQLDEELALALVNELERRGIDVRGNQNHHIVLISEADTVYGRALPAAFRAATVARNPDPEEFPSIDEVRKQLGKRKEVTPPQNVHVFSYLRGLDGRTARSASRDSDDKKKTSTAEEGLKRAASTVGQAAEGEIQFDYLERLASMLQGRHRIWSRESKMFDPAGIRAIGILGSDLYDKLVILEAMRQRFPEALFFTTDMDGRLWDAPSLALTRNLVVASAFDPFHPRGDEGIRDTDGRFAPLRDNAQAGLYYAVRLAVVAPGTSVPPPVTEPLLFEIGRRRPVELSMPGDRAPRRQDGFANRFGRLQWVGFFLVIAGVIGLGGLWRLTWSEGATTAPSPVQEAIVQLESAIARFKWWYGMFVLVALFVAAIVFRMLSRGPGGEPLAVGEGVSVWPTEWIRLAIILFVGGLIPWAWFGHKLYRLQAWRDYFAPEQTEMPPDFAIEPLPLPQPRKVYPGWVSATDLFFKYVRDARLYKRMSRTVSATALYMIFGYGLFFVYGMPVRPIRGELASRIDIWCLVLAIVAFIFLTFYVIDTTLVTRRLLNGLAKALTKWPDWVVRRQADRLGLQAVGMGNGTLASPLEQALEGLIDVEYASQHTKELGGRLYLPFIVMLMMIVSRSRLFDNWGWPLSMILINVFSLALVLACSFLSRRAAQQVRACALGNLSPHIVAAEGLGAAATARPNLEDLKNIRAAINGVRRGAYAQLRYDPAVLAVLIPTGGYGIFVLLFEVALGMH
ncbi:MAG: hypothetical protein ACREJO_17845 [Phycisphaerales bacterium]